MVIDGGVFTIPLIIGVVVAVLGAVGGAGAGCYATTGNVLCMKDGDFPFSPFDPCNGTEDRVFASWRPIQSASTDITVSLRAAHTHSKAWASGVESVTTSPTARFILDAVGGAAWFVSRSTGLPMPLTLPRAPEKRSTFSTTYELMTEEQDSLTVTCPPGIVWQWTLEVNRCGEAASAVGTKNVRCTPNVEEPPCCLPGYEVTPIDPFHGGCMKAHDGVPTRLRSAPCELLKVKDPHGTLEYARAQRAALASAARPGKLPAASGAAVGLFIVQLAWRRRARNGPALV